MQLVYQNLMILAAYLLGAIPTSIWIGQRFYNMAVETPERPIPSGYLAGNPGFPFCCSIFLRDGSLLISSIYPGSIRRNLPLL